MHHANTNNILSLCPAAHTHTLHLLVPPPSSIHTPPTLLNYISVYFTLPWVAWFVTIMSILFLSLAERMSEMSLIRVRTSSARTISSDALEDGEKTKQKYNTTKTKTDLSLINYYVLWHLTTIYPFVPKPFLITRWNYCDCDGDPDSSLEAKLYCVASFFMRVVICVHTHKHTKKYVLQMQHKLCSVAVSIQCIRKQDMTVFTGYYLPSSLQCNHPKNGRL